MGGILPFVLGLIVGAILMRVLLRQRDGRDLRQPPDFTAQPRMRTIHQVQQVPPPAPADVTDQIATLLHQRRKIEAIKLYRDATGAGLKEAKDAVEAIDRVFTR